MTNRQTSELRPHPENARIYGDRADQDLVDSVREFGILTPLLVTRDGVIISGHRRLDAARRCGLAWVPVIVSPHDDDLDILEAVIESNRQREKTNEQLGREADRLLHIETERAALRRRATQNNHAAEAVPVNSPEQKGEARERVGHRLGIGATKAIRAADVVRTIDQLEQDGKRAEAYRLRSTLNDKSVHRAWQEANEIRYPVPRPTPEPPTTIAPVLLAEWRQLDDAGRAAVLNRPRSKTFKFNDQTSDSIEWARWSWNPVTGCLHNCSYCYARDIAERLYPQKFVPAFLPERLDGPRNTPLPAKAATDIGYRNVFTCSMADLFGKWVPREWIDAVLGSVRDNPQWNFLFLTKFPRRLAEFEFPPNAWVGTSVDAQARVKNAEDAMRDVRATVKWYSCEPMLEPLEFSDLSLVDWIVMGGASASTETPAFHPPLPWICHLRAEARGQGCRVFMKTNLFERDRDYPGQEHPAEVDVPSAFKMQYLKRDVLAPAAYEREMELPT